MCKYCFQLIEHVFRNVIEQVVSPFPPSDKIGITSVQRAAEEIVYMKEMKMDWVPYIPYGKRYLFLIFLLIGSSYSY